MKKTIFSLILITLFLTFSGSVLIMENISETDDDWPQWRGPNASGVITKGNPPIEWSENKNVKWKKEIPGAGHATPIVWGDQIIVLTAIASDKKSGSEEAVLESEGNSWMSANSTDYIHDYVVMSIDRGNGKIQWKTTVHKDLPHTNTHQLGSWASNSPVTDGKHIYAYFGSEGLYCLDMDGKLIWERDFGLMEKHMNFGEGSSPVLHGNKIILQRDHNGQSTLHVLDKATGENIWLLNRDEITSWSTPLVINFDGVDQIITSATNKIRSNDLANGKLIWECTGLTRNVIPMPVTANGMVYLMSGFRGSALLAIDLSKAKGDITGTDAIVWTHMENTPYTPSPVLMNGKLYILKVNNGYLSCLDAKDGKVYYSSQKIEGIKNIYGSPIGVKDRIYIPGSEGVISVVKEGPEFKVLAHNTLDDGFRASPVVVGDKLYLRGLKYLYCISE